MGDELTADFTKALPSGALDDATFEVVESALDRAEVPAFAGGKWLTLAERVEALIASREEAERDAHELTKALTGLTVGGSEFFIRKRGRYLADIPACVQHIRERDQRNHRMIVDATVRAKAAETRGSDLLAALQETWRVLRAAGTLNLTRGVELGQTSWYVKISDAEALSDAAIAQAEAA